MNIIKFFKNKKVVFIFFFLLFLGILPVTYSTKKGKFWIKTNFPSLYKAIGDQQAGLKDTKIYEFYRRIKGIPITSNIDEKNKKYEIRRIDSFWHEIEAEIIPAQKYLTDYNSKSEKGIPGGYMDFLDEKNILVTNGVGNVFIYNFENKIFKNINSNLNDIYLSQDFKGKNIKGLYGKFGIKDMFIDKLNSKVFVSLTAETAKGNACYGMGIFSSDIPNNFSINNPENLNFQPFFITDKCNKFFNGHATGGRIKKFKENIIFTVGDLDHNLYGDISVPQDKDSAVGKIISIKKDGSFEVLSMGHRNPQGLTIIDNKIFISEHGPKGGDEINLIQQGGHYGWPYFSYGFRRGKEIFRMPHQEPFVKPVYYFSPSIGISEIIFYKPNLFKYWSNKIIVSSMRTQSLWLLDYDSKKNSVMSQERIKIGHRIRDLGISPAGKIVIITDDQNIIRLAPSKEPKWQDSKKVKFYN